MNKIRVVIVDDHTIFRMGLKSLLGTHPQIEIIADFGDGAAAVRRIPHLKPDVVIMDLMMPTMDGIETTRRLLEQLPEAHVLALTSDCTSDTINAALEAGACGVVLKTLDFDELISAIYSASVGERVLSAEIEQILAEDPPVLRLSPRQREMLAGIMNGLSNTDLSMRLDISKSVVKEHLSALYVKLGAANRAEAIAIATRKHLIRER